MNWEEGLCLATIPVAVLLVFSGLTGLTVWAEIGLLVASLLVALILVLRRIRKRSSRSRLEEILVCERSDRYVGIDHEGAVVCGDRQLQVTLPPNTIVRVNVKVNSTVVATGARTIDQDIRSKLKGEMVKSCFLEISTREPAVQQFVIHLLAKGRPRHLDTIAIRRAMTKAEYWLRNLRA
ncbi:hypothetical protein KXR64_20100 [Brucella intermedia]|uniref:hypothetical protein n=1 Tax=Brucella TaxID=234 RepID=UPI000946249A|nr:hypothetical protein [Brucella intermedia]